MDDRILCPSLLPRVTTADQAALLIESDTTVGFGGFTTGMPKLLPLAMAAREELHGLTLLNGAAFGPHLFGPLVQNGTLSRFAGFHFDISLQEATNDGRLAYIDCHLSQMADKIRKGDFGPVAVSVIECAKVNADGSIVPSVAAGITNALVECSRKLILEINRAIPVEIETLYDLCGAGAPPLQGVLSRVGNTAMPCAPDKIAAIVFTDEPELDWDFREPDETSEKMAANVIMILNSEIRAGRLPQDFTFQIGAGDVANAVLSGMRAGGYRDLKLFTEVFTTGAIEYFEEGLITEVSATCFDCDRIVFKRVWQNFDRFQGRVVLRPIEYTNGTQNVRALDVVSMNTAVEVDIYGNVNSTSVMGARMIHGIGGANDFARNANLSIFFTPATVKSGRISSIVPMVTHVDCTEHDTDVIVTEYGYADLRGRSPKERAALLIENCAAPEYRPQLRAYYEKALSYSGSAQTPHNLDDAFFMHRNFKETGTMLVSD